MEHTKTSSSSSSEEIITTYTTPKVLAYHTFPTRKVVKSPFQKRIYVKYGIVAFSWKTQRWLLMNQNYTPFFTQILTGSYRNSDLLSLLRHITVDELESLQKLSEESFAFNDLFYKIFPNSNLDDLVYAKERFLGNGTMFIQYKADETQPTSLTWDFPCEPLLNERDNPVDCALRAFKEHTSLSITPKEKSFLGYDPFCVKEVGGVCEDQRCESRYWLVIYMDEPKIMRHNLDCENVQMNWCNSKEAIEMLGTQKGKIIEQAEAIIKENFLF